MSSKFSQLNLTHTVFSFLEVPNGQSQTDHIQHIQSPMQCMSPFCNITITQLPNHNHKPSYTCATTPHMQPPNQGQDVLSYSVGHHDACRSTHQPSPGGLLTSTFTSLCPPLYFPFSSQQKLHLTQICSFLSLLPKTFRDLHSPLRRNLTFST